MFEFLDGLALIGFFSGILIGAIYLVVLAPIPALSLIFALSAMWIVYRIYGGRID